MEIYSKRDDQPSIRNLQNHILRLERQTESLQEMIQKLILMQDPQARFSNAATLSMSGSCSSLQGIESLDATDSPSRSFVKRESQLSVTSLSRIRENEEEDEEVGLKDDI